MACRVLVKKQPNTSFIDLTVAKALNMGGFKRFSTTRDTVHKLRTISVGGCVDNMFALRYKPRRVRLPMVCTKIDQSAGLALFIHLPTIAVGVPVDKVFVKRCGPLYAGCGYGWLKFDRPF